MASARDIPIFDAGDPDHVARRGSEIGGREAIRLDGLKMMMQSPAGRAWLRDLLAFCGVGRSCYRGNSDTFFLEGQQNVGHRIMSDITTKFKKEYILMLEEGDIKEDKK